MKLYIRTLSDTFLFNYQGKKRFSMPEKNQKEKCVEIEFLYL